MRLFPVLILKIFPHFWKNQSFDFFLKFKSGRKFWKIMLIFSNYECLQSNKKSAISASGNSTILFLFFKSPKGEFNFRVPPEDIAPTDNRQTSLSRAMGTFT